MADRHPDQAIDGSRPPPASFCFAIHQQNTRLDVTNLNNQSSIKGWKTMPYIIGNEMCSMVANIGLFSSMILYLVQEYHFEQVRAANVLNAVQASKCLMTLLGGFLADTYLGRFRTIVIASCLDVLGMLLLLMSAAIPSLRPASCPSDTHLPSLCPQASHLQLFVLYSAFSLTVLAAGGLRPCAFVFGADQFSHDTIQDRKNIQSFFNWYFFVIYLALVIAATFIMYLQQAVGWSWGYAVPTMAMVLAILVFMMGTNKYNYVPPSGSPIKPLARVVIAALYKRRIPVPVNPRELHGFDEKKFIGSKIAHNGHFRFFDKAAIEVEGEVSKEGAIIRPWRLCTLQQVEDLKLMIRILPIWFSGMFHAIAAAQSGTFVILQAKTMDRRMGTFLIPAGSIGVFPLLALLLCLPIYDRLLLPAARRLSKNERGVPFLQRIGAGYGLGMLAMLVSGMVEAKRRSTARKEGLKEKPWETISMSVFWLAPQLCLMGIAEALNGVGLTEFYYHEMPESMRGVAGALGWCSGGVGILGSSLLINCLSKWTSWFSDNINRAHIDFFYYVVAALLAINLLIFSACSRLYNAYNSTIPVLSATLADSQTVICHAVTSSNVAASDIDSTSLGCHSSTSFGISTADSTTSLPT